MIVLEWVVLDLDYHRKKNGNMLGKVGQLYLATGQQRPFIWANQSLFFFLYAACLAEKQQIPIL